MAEQVSFDEWFSDCGGDLNGEAKRLMMMSWNAALTNGDRHFFVTELAQALEEDKSASWNDLLSKVREQRSQQ